MPMLQGSIMSELYQLPDGWEWKKLSDIGKISTGKTPSKSNKEFYENGMIRFVKPPNLQNSIEIKKTEADEFITENGAKKSTLLPKNSLMVCCIGSLGKFALSTENVITNQQINTIIFNDGLINYKYGYYYGFMFEKLLNEVANEAVVKIVNKTIFSNLDIPLPPLPEQQHIVTKLDALFEKIDKAIALHVKNMEEADSFMASVLNEVFSELEEKYGKVTLNSMANFQNGFAFKSNEFNSNGDGLQVIRIGNVLDLNKNQVYIDERREFEKYLLKANDIVISMTGTRGKMDYLFVRVVNEESCYLNQRVGKISNKNNAHFKYLYYFLQSNIFRDQIFQYETGTVNQGNISSKDIMNQNIPNSPLPIQQKVVTYLDDLSSKIEHVKKVQKEKMESLKALKASILDSAFRGEL